MDGVGRTFAEALARKDFDGVAALLDPNVDFRALTPSRAWEATGPAGVVDVLRTWFEDDDEFEDRLQVTTDAFADRQRVAYRLYVRSGGERYVGEQQAYYAVQGGRIAWLRVLCSGFRPLAG